MCFSLAIEFAIVVWYVYMSGILRTAETKSILGVRDDRPHFLPRMEAKEMRKESGPASLLSLTGQHQQQSPLPLLQSFLDSTLCFAG